ncbi:MAG: hypothetical protein J7M26_05220, partial [Armatimonadetes bacterium]|nr:hypothetical protein [Armatimonadota bacterium]
MLFEGPLKHFLPDSTGPPDEAARLDWLADFVLPATVFGLLATLVYFLVDLRQYLAGGEAALLRYIVFWFLLGVIGLARMAARPGSSMLSPEAYSLLLGGAVLLVIFQWSSVEGSFAGVGGQSRPSLALVLNVLTVAGIWVAAWLLTFVCTRPEHAIEDLQRGQGPATLRYSRVTAAPVRAVLAVSVVALALFGYGLAIVSPHSPVHHHAYVCAVLYLAFALVLLALINLSGARLTAHRAGLQVRRHLAPTWVVGAALAALLALAVGVLLPAVASRLREREPGQTGAPAQVGADRWGRGV